MITWRSHFSQHRHVHNQVLTPTVAKTGESDPETLQRFREQSTPTIYSCNFSRGAVLPFQLTNMCGTNQALKCQQFPPKSGVREELQEGPSQVLWGPSRPHSNHLEKVTRQEARRDTEELVDLEVVQEITSNPLEAPTTHPLPPEGNFQLLQLTCVTSFSSPTSAQV